MREPFWTLGMAAAWIAHRSPEAVREVWPRALEAVGAPLIAFGLALDDEEPALSDAAADLWDALSVGGVTATGFAHDDLANRVEIPAAKWADLSAVPELDVAYDVVRDLRRGSRSGYEQVVVQRAQVAARWPSLEGTPERQKRLAPMSDADVDQLYVARVASFDGKRPPTVHDDRAWGSSVGIKREAITDLRRRFAPDEWSKSGPRGSRS